MTGSPPRRVRDLFLAVGCLALAHPIFVPVLFAALCCGIFVDPYFLAAPLVWLVGGAVIGLVSRDRLPGRSVRPSEQPALSSVVQRVADALGFESPLLVRLVPEPGAALGQTRVRGVRATVLLLGWPMVRFLSEAELAAVVAHELAHAQHVRRRSAALVQGARSDLVESLEDRFGFPLKFKIRLLEATRPSLWADELESDAQSAKVVGGEAVRSALKRTEVVTATWDLLADGIIGSLAEKQEFAEDLYEALEQALEDQVAVDRALADLSWHETLDLPSSPSHPPLEQRLRAVGGLPGSEVFSAAPVAFRDRGTVDHWAARVAAEQEEDVHLCGVSVIAAASGWGVERAQRLGLVNALGEATWQGALIRAVDRLVADPAALGLALDPELRRAPKRVRGAIAERFAASCTATVIALGLVDHGWRRASRWTGAVVVDPDGRQVDVPAVAEGAVRSGDKAALLDLATVAIGGRR